MAVRQIQIRQNADQKHTRQSIGLDDVRFRLWAHYCKHSDRWFLTIADLDDNPVVGSIAAVPGVDLLRPYKHLSSVPQGELFVQSVRRESMDASNADVSAVLLYREA